MKSVILGMVKALGKDVKVATFDNIVNICINDTYGFNDEWELIPRPLLNPNGVKALCAWIEAMAIDSDRYGSYFYADGTEVMLSWGSDDQ